MTGRRQARTSKGKEKVTETETEVPVQDYSQIPAHITTSACDPTTYGIVLSSEEHNKRFVKLIKRGIAATRYGDPSILEKMGIGANVADLLEAAGLTRCLAPRPTYLKFVLEFFSTLELRERSMTCGNENYTISFQLLNEQRSLDNVEIGEIYGFPDISVGASAYQLKLDAQQFWGQITAAPGLVAPRVWNPKQSKCTQIRSPVVKYLQKLLGNTFFGRKELSSPRLLELEVLHAIVDRQSREFQEDLVRCFEKVVREVMTSKKKEPKLPDPVYCGALITPILEHFRMPLPSFQPITREYLLRWDELEHMRIVILGFQQGRSGPTAPYVYQNEPPYLRLPNSDLTYITNLRSTANLQLVTDLHRIQSVYPDSDEISKYGQGQRMRLTARPRGEAGEEAGEDAGEEAEEEEEAGGSQARGRRKRSSASIRTLAELHEYTEGRLSAMGDDISEMRTQLTRIEASQVEIKESQNKLLELFNSIKGCFTSSTSSPRQ